MSVMHKSVRALPSTEDVETIAYKKYGPSADVGWAPRRRQTWGYHLPADVYEATVAKFISIGCSWIDIGGGHNIFPQNPTLARELVARASRVVAVDPDPTVAMNDFVSERSQCAIEDYDAPAAFDIATLRMVVEHVKNPDAVAEALGRLVRRQGFVIVYTVNAWSPVSVISRFTPFDLHFRVKRILWGGAREDTFPVEYKLNTRKALANAFARHGLLEEAFCYLDDLSVFGRFRFLNYIELLAWATLHSVGLRYPENCLLGVYRRA